MEPFYRIIEHTADIGIEVDAPDREGIFTRAARAMFELMCGLQPVGRTEKRRLSVQAETVEELLIAWLNEVLYVYSVEMFVFSEFSEVMLDDTSFSACGWGERSDMERIKGGLEIKAATYHDTFIKQVGDRWRARVIFDV